jgi:hypothetical protein
MKRRSDRDRSYVPKPRAARIDGIYADTRSWLRSSACTPAHRPIATHLLARAEPRDTSMGRIRVISAEGLIAFKLQGYVNDASRLRDLDDIRALLRQHHATLNMTELRQYFALFDRQPLLDELLAQTIQSGT